MVRRKTMPDSLIKSVSDTAFMVAAWRAAKSERPDALFRDPFAGPPRGRARQGHRRQPARGGFIGRMAGGDPDDHHRRSRYTAALHPRNQDHREPGRRARPTPLPDGAPRIAALDRGRLPACDRLEARAAFAAERPRCRLERVKLDLANLPARRDAACGARRRVDANPFLDRGGDPLPHHRCRRDAGRRSEGRSGAPPGSSTTCGPRSMRYRKRGGRQLADARGAVSVRSPSTGSRSLPEHGWRPAEIRYLAEEAARLQQADSLPLPVKLLMGLRRLFSPNAIE